jgi:FHS family L-fucose permease-like MFS transporter
MQAHNRFLIRNPKLPFILVTTLFLFWGIPNNMNDILIKQFMKSFTLDRFQAGLVQSAFYLGYFVLAIPAGLIMKRFSYKTGLMIGLVLSSAGSILFWPAALAGKYSSFLIALFIIASGLSFLETGANPFIASLGDPAKSAQRLNFSQSFNPVGSIFGVIIGTAFIFSGIENSEAKIKLMKAAGEYGPYLKSETLRVVTPYVILGCVVFLWAILILFTHFPEKDVKSNDENLPKGKIKDLFKYPHFLKGIFAQFCYVGAQVGTWSYYMQYIQDFTGKNEKFAGFMLTGTLVAFGIGRFTSTFLMKFFKPDKLMGIYSIVNAILLINCIVYPGWVGVFSIFLTSFFMSLMYPTIFALGIKGLGENTKLGGSLIVMSIIGGAVFTPLMGIISIKTHSMALAMMVPLFCYLVIGWYAFKGSVYKGISLEPDPSAILISH